MQNINFEQAEVIIRLIIDNEITLKKKFEIELDKKESSNWKKEIFCLKTTLDLIQEYKNRKNIINLLTE